MSEQIGRTPELLRVFESISGNELEDRIHRLAEISTGEIIGKGGSRLTLTGEDMKARKWLGDWMQQAGMTVYNHPLGLIGTYDGSDPDLPAIGFGSHFDTVPVGGAYDGAVGVIGAIAAVDSFHKAGIKTKRPLKVFCFTGEESSRFGIATFGSRGMCGGLTDEILARPNKAGETIKQSLINLGLDPSVVSKPIIDKNPLNCFIELHVQQEDGMAEEGVQIGVVENIAAPVRFNAVFGKPQPENQRFYPSNQTLMLRFTISGIAGHSGAVPMGLRADGLVAAANFMFFLAKDKFPEYLTQSGILPQQDRQRLHELLETNEIMMGIVDVKSGAINKIPGITEMMIAIDGNNPQSLGAYLKAALTLFMENTALDDFVGNYTKIIRDHSKFIFELRDVERSSIDPFNYIFYPVDDVLDAQLSAAGLVRTINETAVNIGDKNVGTAGYMTFKSNGQIVVPVDIRGIHPSTRYKVVKDVTSFIKANNGRVQNKSEEKPAIMDVAIADKIYREAKELGFVVERLDSHAGHDAMNFVNSPAGTPTAMIFIPSRNGGVSHVPEEYSTPDDLENGVKTLATTVYSLAQA